MSSKNEARRIKKKAERAKNRAIVVKERLRIIREGSSSKEQFTSSVRKSILDSLTIIGIMDQTIFTMSRLKALASNVLKRDPAFHTKELNDKFIAAENEADLAMQDMNKIRQIFITYSEQLENPNVTIEQLSESATKIQNMKMNENELMDGCAAVAKKLVDLVDESNSLYDAEWAKHKEMKTDPAEGTLDKLLSDKDYNLLRIYAGLSIENIEALGTPVEEVPFRSGYMRPAGALISERASEVTTYTSEYTHTVEDSEQNVSTEPSVQQVMTDYATESPVTSTSE